MFDIGWTELLVIGVVALIVVGPKDLPGMFRTLGRFTAKARSMAREFSRAMEEAADESGVGELAKDLKNVTSSKNLGLDKIKDAATKFEDWDPINKNVSAKKGAETKALSEERAEAARKIHAATAKKASDRLARDAKQEIAADVATAKPEVKKSVVKKPKTRKPATKLSSKSGGKPPTRKATSVKTTGIKPAVKKPNNSAAG